MIMSFSFNGIGPRAEVIRQVRSHHIEGEGLGHHARELVVQALEAAEQLDKAETFGGQTLYIVKAYGHSGNGGATSLAISIEPVWVPALRPEARAVTEHLPTTAGVDGEDLGIGEPAAAGDFRTSV